VARAEDGAELDVPKAAAIVSAGFGVFVHGGGFALDRAALQRAGLSESEARRRVRGLAALEYAVLAPAALIAGAVVLIEQQAISPSLTLPWIIGVPVGAAIALVALHFRSRHAHRLSRSSSSRMPPATRSRAARCRSAVRASSRRCSPFRSTG
jgi:hypothetical protein